MTRLAPWGLALAAALVAGLSVRACQTAERRIGVVQVQLATAEAARDSLAARRAVADAAYRVDTLRLTKWNTRWDSAKVGALQSALDSARRNPSFRSETIPVPVAAIIAADSAILSCRAVVTSCEVRLALADSLTANAVHRLVLTRRLVNAPRTAVGLAYDPHTGRVGASVDRDWWRVRAGVTVVPGAFSVRASLWW